MGDKIDLTAPQSLTAPAATWIELTQWTVDLSSKPITVKYVWHSDSGVITVNGNVEQSAQFTNIEDDPATPENEQNREYNAIFRQEIAADDVGKRTGRLFKLAILNKLKIRILSAGVDIDPGED